MNYGDFSPWKTYVRLKILLRGPCASCEVLGDSGRRRVQRRRSGATKGTFFFCFAALRFSERGPRTTRRPHRHRLRQVGPGTRPGNGDAAGRREALLALRAVRFVQEVQQCTSLRARVCARVCVCVRGPSRSFAGKTHWNFPRDARGRAGVRIHKILHCGGSRGWDCSSYPRSLHGFSAASAASNGLVYIASRLSHLRSRSACAALPPARPCTAFTSGCLVSSWYRLEIGGTRKPWTRSASTVNEHTWPGRPLR